MFRYAFFGAVALIWTTALYAGSDVKRVVEQSDGIREGSLVFYDARLLSRHIQKSNVFINLLDAQCGSYE